MPQSVYNSMSYGSRRSIRLAFAHIIADVPMADEVHGQDVLMKTNFNELPFDSAVL